MDLVERRDAEPGCTKVQLVAQVVRAGRGALPGLDALGATPDGPCNTPSEPCKQDASNFNLPRFASSLRDALRPGC